MTGLKIIMVVIAVSNARSYHEDVQYAVRYPTEQACMTAAANYPDRGTYYQKAVCVPELVAPQQPK